MYENINTPLAGASMVNLPSTFVIVPPSMPLTRTETPINGSLASSRTTPYTVIFLGLVPDWPGAA